MKYLKVFTDFAADMKELGDAERGRLFTAMLNYAATGEEPSFKGNEKFIWGTAKKNIDNQRMSYDSKCESMATAREHNPNNNKLVSVQTDIRQKTDRKEQKTVEEQEQEQEQEQKKEKSKRKKDFSVPTLEEVKAYCDERHNSIDPEAFIDFYESKGWKVGNQAMKDWKAAVRTWEKGDGRSGRTNKPVSAQNKAEHREPAKDYSYLYSN